MPELPEVETVRRGLNDVTLHQVIHGGAVLLDRTIAYPSSSQEFLDNLQGWAIAQWHRRGKYLLAEVKQMGNGEWGAGKRELVTNSDGKNGIPITGETRESGVVREFLADPFSSSPPPTSHPRLPAPLAYLGVHLRMTGQLLWLDQNEPVEKHTRVRLFFPGGKELRFVDQRTFGQMWWVPPGQSPETVITGLQQLGPEPFSDEFSPSYFLGQLQHRKRPIKNALLDQAIVAGVGNIYADEALFSSKIHPATLCADLSRQQIECLRTNIIQVLQASIEAKGTTFRTFRSVEGVNGNYGGVAWVYARDGDVCKTCGTVIERLRMAGRSAHFCPNCQRQRK